MSILTSIRIDVTDHGPVHAYVCDVCDGEKVLVVGRHKFKIPCWECKGLGEVLVDDCECKQCDAVVDAAEVAHVA